MRDFSRLKDWIQYLAVSAVIALLLMMAYQEVFGEVDIKGALAGGIVSGLFAKWCEWRSPEIVRQDEVDP